MKQSLLIHSNLSVLGFANPFLSLQWGQNYLKLCLYFVYSCNKITTTQIEMFFFANISRQIMIKTNFNSFWSKKQCYKLKKVKKLVLNSQLLTVQILTNDVEVLIVCLSYFNITVMQGFLKLSGLF